MKCEDLYFLNKIGQCSLAPVISNCLNQVGLTCNSCIDGYNLANNNCIYYIPNCLIVQDKMCTTCNSGYFIMQNGTCDTGKIIFDPNCKTYNINLYLAPCTQCSEEYFLNDQNFCEKVNPLCLTYNSQNGKCLSCIIGYKLQTDSGKGQLIPINPAENCQTYDKLQKICIKCQLGAILDAFGRCRRQPDIKCKISDSDFISCKQCFPGYYVDSNTKICVKSPLKCLKYDIHGHCKQCTKNQYLDKTSLNCIQYIKHCKKLDLRTKTCNQCQNGYLVYKNTCEFIENIPFEERKCYAHCLNYNPKNLNSRLQCQQSINRCKQFDQKTGLCISCFNNFKLLKGRCMKFFDIRNIRV